MAFNLRKLLGESDVVETIARFCEPFCDPTTNPSGCPPKCVDLCISNCIYVKSLFPPPPPPSEFVGGYSAPDHTSRLSLILVIALAILVTCFFLFSCYTIYKFFNLNWYSLSRRREPPRRGGEELGPNDFLDAEQGPVVDHYLWYIRTVGLEPSVISKIAIVKYKKGDGLVEGTDCAVCLNEFQEDETLRLLPKCSHAFHIPCIDTWLNSHTNCPICRAGIVNNTVMLPSEELVVQNSGMAEGTTRAGVSESSRGVGRGSEDHELRIGIGDENESRDVIGLKLVDTNGGLDEIQPRRRSVSVDSLSASIISGAISMNFPAQSNRESATEPVETDVAMVARREGSDQRFLTGSSSITRSISCSARLFLSRYSCGTRDWAIPR